MTDEVRFEIRTLTGQDYRHHYAGDTATTATDAPVVANPVRVTEADNARDHQRALVSAR